VLNVSEPAGRSFNDNVDKLSVERGVMDTAKSFSYKLLRAGKNARLVKTDVKDAFKNMPARIKDLNLQGFMVEDRFFIELRMIFGACTALAHYDVLGNTIESLAVVASGIPKQFISRAVDDQPVATPAGSTWGEDFVSSYRKICNEINIELAEDCPKCDKAFTDSKRGKVLGVWFDSEKLTWKLPDEKARATIDLITTEVSSKTVGLDVMQTLLGRLNFVCMMYPFLKIFSFNMNKELARRVENPSLIRDLSIEAKTDLLVHRNFLEDQDWYPIAGEPIGPPPSAAIFVTDAAGLPDGVTWTDPIGCGIVGFDADGSMIHAAQFFWPPPFISEAVDKNGLRFGNKTTTLECIGMLFPLLTIPDLLAGRHVVLRVDNIACVYGFENGQSKRDETASIMIRAAKLIAAYLGSTLHVEHVARRSNWEAELADNLTRKRTTGFIEDRAISRFTCKTLSEALVSWLKLPVEDWSLPFKLLDHVKAVSSK
jgi:hypothetical protein